MDGRPWAGPSYRLALCVAASVLFAIQKTVTGCLPPGSGRVWGGYLVTLGFFAALAELSTWRLGRRLGRVGNPGPRSEAVGVAVVASILLAMDLAAKHLGPYLGVQRRPPPTWPLLIVVAGWVAILRAGRRSPAPGAWVRFGLCGLVLATGWLVVLVSPFEWLPGDMLAAIDRSLDLLVAGRFPYIEGPPPMPYLPGILLAYAPPMLLGIDLRVSNLALATATAGIVLVLARRAGGAGTRLETGSAALALMMLSPAWVFLGVNTHFAPSLFTTALLGLAIKRGGPRSQALALGLAAGTNQMLAAAGPILLGSWIRRFGPRRAVAATALAMATFLAIAAPFLLWSPAAFVRVAFLSRTVFPHELMAGRFTVLPLFDTWLPAPTAVLTALVVGIAAVAAGRSRDPDDAVAAVSLGLAAAIFVQPMSFSHYLMPSMVLAALPSAAHLQGVTPEGSGPRPTSRPRHVAIPPPRGGAGWVRRRPTLHD